MVAHLHWIVIISLAASSVATIKPAAQPAPRDASPADVTFTPAARAAGLDFHHINGASSQKHLVETMGSGALFFDYDNDSWIDIVLVDGGSLVDPSESRRARHRLYRNQGNGKFADVTIASGIEHRAYGMGACAADYDNDGWTDLYLTNFGPNTLYRNKGNGTFTDVSRTAGVATPLWSTSCTFVDVDRDGDLDLFVVNYLNATVENNRFCGDASKRRREYCHPNNYDGAPNLFYRNNGDGTFSDATRSAGLQTKQGKGLGVVAGDYDADGWPDLFVANDSVPNFLYRNERDGSFSEVALKAGVAVATDGKARAGMGTDFGDYDGDGMLDLIVTNHELETHTMFRNLGGGLFEDVTFGSGVGPATLPFVGFGVVFCDYDNDGTLDLAIANGHVLDDPGSVRPGATHAQRRLLFRGFGRGRMQETGRRAGMGFRGDSVGRALIAGDIDNDGDVDLLATNNGQMVDLLRNDGDSRNNALLVRTVGRGSNRDGFGARLLVTVGARRMLREAKAASSYLGQNDPRVHFGLGSATRIERLEVYWPTGKVDVVRDVAANQVVTIVEGQGLTSRTPFSGR